MTEDRLNYWLPNTLTHSLNQSYIQSCTYIYQVNYIYTNIQYMIYYEYIYIYIYI